MGTSSMQVHLTLTLTLTELEQTPTQYDDWSTGTTPGSGGPAC